jgi:hypothetical protein
MAQVQNQHITLGGSRGIGSVSVDGGAVRAEGGPVRPQLIVPLTIQMNAMPSEAMLGIVWLWARLAMDQFASPHMAICQPISEPLINGFHVHSVSRGVTDYTVQLRFFLTPAEVEDVEQRRHAGTEDVFALYLGLDALVAGFKTYNEMQPGQQLEATTWDFQYGTFSQLLPFWTTQIMPVRVEVEQSTWVRNVLPGLGYDRSRLIEIAFPPPLPNHPSAASQFDKAKRALDERRYGDCIQECRGLLNMWEKHYGSTLSKRIASIVGSERAWAETDIRSEMLDTLWRKVGDVANAPHHPEGDVDAELFDARDARLILLLTAAVCEYVGRR